MAEAARSVKHYVSDCLEERHPYDVKKGFGGRAERDAGRVFSGFLPGGVDQLLAALSDPSIDDAERAKAMHHLLGHSASQEMKITLLEKGVVPLIVSILQRQPFHLLEHQCHLMLRSLCVIPQGCFPVVDGGGAEAAIRSVRCVDDESQRSEARAAAMRVLLQIASDYAGLRWLLRAEDCEEFKLATADAPSAPVLVRTEDVVSSVQFVLDNDGMHSTVGQHAMATLAQVTLLTPGVKGSIANVQLMDILASSLANVAQEEEDEQSESILLGRGSVASVSPLLTALWNIALDQDGVEALDSYGAPEQVMHLFRSVCVDPDAAPRHLHRSLMGALSAMYKLTSVKLASTEPLGEASSRVLALIGYLQWVNSVVDAGKAAGREPSADILAISKNTVQCLRLASEVRAVRTITHEYIDSLQGIHPNSAFYFRRQLYYSTAWEAEYEAHV